MAPSNRSVIFFLTHRKRQRKIGFPLIFNHNNTTRDVDEARGEKIRNILTN